MVYTGRDELTVIKLDNGNDSVSIEKLKKVLVESPSNMIYCEAFGKLAGIISTGDILRAYRSDLEQVQVNRNFTCIHDGECMKARNIFKDRETINAIPVITKDNILAGDYTRWDDFWILDYELDIGEFLDWDDRQHIALVRPNQGVAERQRIFDRFEKFLKMQNIAVKIIDRMEVSENVDKNDMILYVDENEIRAGITLMEIVSGRESVGNINTYKNFLGYSAFANRQRISFFKNLYSNDIKILGLIFEKSVYYENLLKKMKEKYIAVGEKPFNEWPESAYMEFFDDLYSENYVEEIMNIPFAFEYTGGVWKLKDFQSRYYNVIDGERCTENQPEKNARSIYFFGPCYIYGLCVEDKNTIESYLQRRINDTGALVRVVNCGCYGMHIGYEYFSRIVVTKLKRGDIVVISQPGISMDEMIYLDLNAVLEKNHVGAEWLINESRHCNHKVNKLYADAIYEILEPFLVKKVKHQGELIEKDLNFVKFLYLDRYFMNFDSSNYDRIGSIVMNCNPFTWGHRYLIERALACVDYLIIFVVEEDRSFFSFEERFVMVREGTADLKDVMVVPSGPFILSQISFPEYFIKEISDDIVEHTEQDIITFAEIIASQLNIKFRFVGEEPEDEVTNQYNSSMKRILPGYGIELIEIPRKRLDDQYISASSARKLIEENDRETIKELLPETTIKIVDCSWISRENMSERFPYSVD